MSSSHYTARALEAYGVLKLVKQSGLIGHLAFSFLLRNFPFLFYPSENTWKYLNSKNIYVMCLEATLKPLFVKVTPDQLLWKDITHNSRWRQYFKQ